MPVQVMITPAEAEAARTAGVGSVQHGSFTYDPKDTFTICNKLTAGGVDGAQRLVTRLADIYGKRFVHGGAAAPALVEPKRAKSVVAPPTEDYVIENASEVAKGSEPGSQPAS